MFINLTPHPVTIVSQDGTKLTEIPPSGELARLKASTVRDSEHEGIPLSKTVFGEPTGIPEYKEGVYLIVSQMIKSALPNREDLVVPAEVVRDEKGQIIGCQSLGL